MQAQNKSNYLPEEKPTNLPDYNEKPLHFGFFLGVQSNRIHLVSHPTFVKLNAESLRQGGFKIGVHALYGLSKHVQARFSPNILFTRYGIESNSYAHPEVRSFSSEDKTFVELPFTMKLNTSRFSKNHRLYGLVGGYYQIDISEKSNNNIFLGNDYGTKLGIGWDAFNKFFLQSVELTYQVSLNNQGDKLGDFQVFEKAYTQSISLNFFFQ